MPRELRGDVFKLATKGPDGRALWAYRLHRGKGGQVGGFRTSSEAKAALEVARDAELAQRRGAVAQSTRRDLTVAELADLYLAAHDVRAATRTKLREHLRASTKPASEGGFGDLPARTLSPLDVATWRSKQPERSAFYYTQALRQLLKWGKDVARVIPENVALAVPNPKPKAREVAFFETWADVERVDDELPEWARGFAIVGAGIGTRPEELLASTRRDVDLGTGVLIVRRAYSKGELHDYPKTTRRRIPLRRRVLDCLRETNRIGVGLDPAGLLFPGIRGGFLDLHNFRARDWSPAVVSAGFGDEDDKATRTPYALRHTYAAFSLAAGVNLYTLARRMGTSVKMIDETYGHLAPDAEQYEREMLDEFDAKLDAEDEARKAAGE